MPQRRLNVWIRTLPVPVFYFYKGPRRTIKLRELASYRDVHGWGI